MIPVTEASTRPAAVAGLFYPASPATLRTTVRQLIERAPPRSGRTPKILVVPHAGYVYSGAMAARGFATLVAGAERLRRVVLLGPAHHVAVRGIAASTAQRFATPLGTVEVDRATVDRLLASRHVVLSDDAHAAEHALEVQLPFLQSLLPSFTLVPLVVGDATAEDVAAVLDQVWGDAGTLIVVSSDLSHYLPYQTARTVDGRTLQQVLRLGPPLDHRQACGATALNGVILAAAARGLEPQLIAACNSGDTAGDRDRVVGYAALAFFDQAPAEDDALGAALLAHARAALEALFKPAGAPLPEADRLNQPGATFVTLRRGGELRGCVGSLEAERPLREDVGRNARAAALNDSRFAPLTEGELETLTIEVSLLSAPEPLSFRDEDDLLRQIGARRQGVILEYRHHRSTFLPQVWEQIPDAREFLRHLKEKAGLPADFWSPELRLSHYAVRKWSEPPCSPT